ncbi:MAG: hypothetical protein JXR58_11030, partial [Bacteroidales bacterium]|nr:hypothetical protein [Bacteroidales bacterium]
MKKLNLLIAGLLLITLSYAQDDSSDTTKIRFGNKNIIIVDGDTISDEDPPRIRNFESQWASMTFGINSYFAPDYKMDLPNESSFMDLNVGKSWEFALNLFDIDFSLIKNRVGLNSGLGFRFNNYRFSNNIILQPTYVSTEDVLAYKIDTVAEFTKNKLSVYGVQVPLMLSFHFPMKEHTLIVSAGAYAGVRYHIFTKQKIVTDNTKIKTKENDDFH